ncbi:MAG: hypothetical protein ACR2NM_07010 [Bythopirellula sp.]
MSMSEVWRSEGWIPTREQTANLRRISDFGQPHWPQRGNIAPTLVWRSRVA